MSVVAHVALMALSLSMSYLPAWLPSCLPGRLLQSPARWSTCYSRLTTSDDIDELLRKLREAEKVETGPSRLSRAKSSSNLTSRNLLNQSKKVSSRRPLLMLSPEGKYRRIWDDISICLVTVVCVLAPLELAFPSSFSPAHTWYAIDLTFDLLSLFEIGLKLRTGVMVSGMSWTVGRRQQSSGHRVVGRT